MGRAEGWQRAFFCRECHGVLPPAAAAADVTHFSRLGLPPDFRVSPRELEARLRAAQWLLHPDKFAQASEEELRRSEGQATLVNESVAVLRDPVKRALYMLELEGVELGEGAGLEGAGLEGARVEGARAEDAGSRLRAGGCELEGAVDVHQTDRRVVADLRCMHTVPSGQWAPGTRRSGDLGTV